MRTLSFFSLRATLFTMLVLGLGGTATAVAQTLQVPVREVQKLLDTFTESAFIESVAFEDRATVKNHLVPLGAMQKVRGVWAPRDSERFSGERSWVTWKVLDGFQSQELIAELDENLAAETGVRLKFSCDARACGSSSQWASRVFSERLLYGREASQRYRVYAIAADSGEPRAAAPAESDSAVATPQSRLVIYGSARSSSRQYLRIEILQGQVYSLQ